MGQMDVWSEVTEQLERSFSDLWHQHLRIELAKAPGSVGSAKSFQLCGVCSRTTVGVLAYPLYSMADVCGVDVPTPTERGRFCILMPLATVEPEPGKCT